MNPVNGLSLTPNYVSYARNLAIWKRTVGLIKIKIHHHIGTDYVGFKGEVLFPEIHETHENQQLSTNNGQEESLVLGEKWRKNKNWRKELKHLQIYYFRVYTEKVDVLGSETKNKFPLET